MLIFKPPAEFRSVNDVAGTIALTIKCDTMNGTVLLHQDACGFELPNETLFTLPGPHRKTHTPHETNEIYVIFGTQHKEQLR